MYKLVAPDRVADSPELRRVLNRVNEEVNRYEYKTDKQLYATEDFWTAQIGRFEAGDCDDYALTKRRMLIELGVPYECLSPTICKVEGEGHLVLVVRTTEEDLVLDNMTRLIRSPGECTGYSWIARLDAPTKEWFRIR